VYYPVFVEGARLYVGDPHFAWFGDDLDAAMRTAAEQMLELLVDRAGFPADVR
jgi:acetamidase/formamidase